MRLMPAERAPVCAKSRWRRRLRRKDTVMTHATYQPEERARQYRILTEQAIDLALKSRWEEAAAINRRLLEIYPRDLSALIQRHHPGDRLTVTFLREYRVQQAVITLA